MAHGGWPEEKPGESAEQYRRRLSGHYAVVDPHKSRFTAPLAVAGAMLFGAAIAGWVVRDKLAVMDAQDAARDARIGNLEKNADAVNPGALVDQVLFRLRNSTVKCPRFVMRGEAYGICEQLLERPK